MVLSEKEKSSLQTTFWCCIRKLYGAERKGKEQPRSTQVRIEEMNASKPLMTYRNQICQRQNRRDKRLTGISTKETCLLFVCRSVSRWHELYSGLFMEQEKLNTDDKGNVQAGKPCKTESTNAVFSGGLTRISDEILVMGIERRGQVIQ